ALRADDRRLTVLRGVTSSFGCFFAEPRQRCLLAFSAYAALVFRPQFLLHSLPVAAFVLRSVHCSPRTPGTPRVFDRVLLARRRLLYDELVVVLDHRLLSSVDPRLLRLDSGREQKKRRQRGEADEAGSHNPLLYVESQN